MDISALPRAGRAAGITVATGLAALLFTACGSSANYANDDAGSGRSAPEAADMAEPEAQSGAESAEEGGVDSVGADVEVGDRQLIHIADMTVRVDDVAEASDLAKEMTVGADGYVADESLSTPSDGSPEGNLTLRIPNEDYESALEALAELGDRSTLERSVEDVTEEVADVESRITSSEVALETLRGYLEKAEDVDDLLRVEGEIQQRQEDLEAFQARLKALENQTAYSTVHLALVPPATYLEETSKESVGFLGGLERGWRALVGLGQGLSVLVGWLLPFAVVVAVVGAWPLWLLRQRRRARRGQVAAFTAAPAGSTTDGSASEGSTPDAAEVDANAVADPATGTGTPDGQR